MTAGVTVRLQKELRTLVWPWAAAMAGLGLVALSQPMLVGFVAVPGALALGAWAVGSEYSQRTLPGLLVQPIPRWQLGAEKLVVVLALIATLVVPAALSPLGLEFVAGVSLAALLAASLAAVLTLMTRTPRTGILFAVAAMFIWTMLIQKVPALVSFVAPEMLSDPRWLSRVLLIYGTVALTISTVALLLVSFARLQALEETHEHVSLIRWRPVRSRTSRARPAHPLVALARKELGLQQVLFVVSGLYLAGWLAVSTQDPSFRMRMVYSLTVIHGLALALLSGAMASAEERRLGTLPWQLLQPVSFTAQWTVKVGVSIGLVLALAIGLPAALLWLDPGISVHHTEFVNSPEVVIALVALVACTLYVSSLSRNGLVAFLVAVPVSGGASIIGGALLSLVARSSALRRLPAFGVPLVSTLTLFVVLGFLLMVLAFAMANHRAGDRAWRRLATQGLAICTYPLATSVLLGLLVILLRS